MRQRKYTITNVAGSEKKSNMTILASGITRLNLKTIFFLFTNIGNEYDIKSQKNNNNKKTYTIRLS